MTLLQVIKEFMTIKMNEAMNTMKEHLQKVQRLKHRIEKQRKKIFENVYNSILLNSVSDAYHIAINILESQEQLTPSIIINRLLEESRKYGEGLENSSEKMKVALLSKSKPGKGGKSTGKKGGSTGGKKDLHCDFCNRNGHEEENCWTKHPELKSKKGKNGGKKGDAKFAMSAAIKSIPISQTSKTHDDTEWYVDSAASEHFSPHRHLFETYEELKEPIQVSTSKEGITTHGIGHGKITLEVVAGSKINQVSLEAMYAPDMDANLLSTSTLLEKGYEISMKPHTGVKILKEGVLVADTIVVFYWGSRSRGLDEKGGLRLLA